MLPTLLRAAGENLADAGLGHSGWVLQRLDEAALDASLPFSALGVRDGEVLYFRPRLAQIPEMMFDDVADVIATGIKDRADRWRPAHTRQFGLTAGAAMLVVGVVALALAGPGWLMPGVTADVLALLLVAGGGLVSRAVGDAGAGAVLGYCALPYAFFGGLVAPARSVELTSLGALHIATGFSVVVMVSLVAGFAIVEGIPGFLGTAAAGLIGVVCAGSVQLFHARPAGTAALAAAICVALSALIPSLAFRLARVPLPPVPASAEELRSAAQLFDGPSVLRRTQEADRFVTGLVTGVSLVVVGAQACIALVSGWSAATMSIVLSAILVLRARVFGGRPQRTWLLAAGLAGFGLLGLRLAWTQQPGTIVGVVVVPLVLAAVLAIALGVRLPRQKPTPFWGRAADIVDLFLVVALIPLALGLLDVYGWARGLAG